MVHASTSRTRIRAGVPSTVGRAASRAARATAGAGSVKAVAVSRATRAPRATMPIYQTIVRRVLTPIGRGTGIAAASARESRGAAGNRTGNRTTEMASGVRGHRSMAALNKAAAPVITAVGATLKGRRAVSAVASRAVRARAAATAAAREALPAVSRA